MPGQDNQDVSMQSEPALRIWESKISEECPFERSDRFQAIALTGRHANYTGADTWYPSWASDGKMYSPWTDGAVNGLCSDSSYQTQSTGHATILGDDPMDLRIVDEGIHCASAGAYGGRYPCGSLVHDGIWYYGTYCLMNENGSREGFVFTSIGLVNWGVLGPFCGFRISEDFGKTWKPSPHTPRNPMFPDPAKFGGPVKIGAPHFVDFGRNMEHSPDGKAYLIAHGDVVPDPKPRIANGGWITGDAVYLIRVTPSIEKINDASQYEFYAGQDNNGKAIWTKDFFEMKPLIEWNNHLGCATVTYNASLKKYLMFVTDGGSTVGKFSTYVLESDNITGPWKLITALTDFGQQAYFVNAPSKFIHKDGRTMWLCYSANFWAAGIEAVDPPGSHYSMSLHEIKLL